MSTITIDGGVKPVSKPLNITLWVLQVLVGLGMITSGGLKLAGAELMVKEFDALGLGQWFRYLTGGWEVVGGVLLLVPRLSGLGALLLTPVMAGAIVAHLVKLPGPFMPALVLLAFLCVIVWGRREQIVGLVRK